MDPLTFVLIEAEARKQSPEPSHDDYLDAIVEVHADHKHMTDEEIDSLYVIFSFYKREQARLLNLDDLQFELFLARNFSD